MAKTFPVFVDFKNQRWKENTKHSVKRCFGNVNLTSMQTVYEEDMKLRS